MEAFKRDGYLVFEGLFSNEEVEEMKNAGIEITKNLPPKEERAVFSSKDTPQAKKRYFLESNDKVRVFFETDALDENGELTVPPEISLNKVGHNLHTLHPVFHKYTYCERIRELCWKLGMVEPAVVQSMYIYKNPKVGSEVTVHQDETYLHTTPEGNLIGIWIALDDASKENGCLYMSPGSHKSGVHRRFIRNPDESDDELLIYTSPLPTYPDSNFVPVPVKKGTCVIIHGLVVHKSEPNKSDLTRHAYTFHLADLHNATFDEENWIQPTAGCSFPRLYKQPPTEIMK